MSSEIGLFWARNWNCCRLSVKIISLTLIQRQLSPSGQERRVLYDPFLNKEKKIAANFQNTSPVISYISILVLCARGTILETMSCSQELCFPMRVNKWLQKGGVEKKDYASGKVCSLNYISPAKVQPFWLFMHNRIISFEIQYEITSTTLDKGRIVNLLPSKSDNGGKT